MLAARAKWSISNFDKRNARLAAKTIYASTGLIAVMSLALSTLVFEWRRYMAAVIALAMSGVLMLALSGLFVGVLRSFTATIERSRGQIIITTADMESLAGPGGGGGALPARVMPLIYRHSEVTDVADLPGDFGQFYAEGATEAKPVNVMVVDTTPDAVTLPADFTDSMRRVLDVPFNVAVDRSALAQLGVKKGDVASLNGRTVRIALILSGYENSQFANLVMSRQTYRQMGRFNDDQLGILMVRVESPREAERVRDELNAMADGQYRAWTKKELSDATVRDVMAEGFISMILMFMSVIGFIIGVAITWQTLRGAILANIKEFASLRALGVSMGSLRWVVMELSIWVGLAGIGFAAIAMAGLTLAASAANIPMGYQLGALVQTGVLLLMIAVGSGVLTLGALKKGEPADLLR
jgi:putative ABC transport system permease protein